MVARFQLVPTFRIIAHRPYDRPLAQRLPSVENAAELDALEALTNPRLREEYMARRKVRPQDAGGNPNVFVMASFTYSGPSRFADGSFGVYYAAFALATAIAESAFHTALFLHRTATASTLIFKRVLNANVGGDYDDVRSVDRNDPIYDPDPENYARAQVYGISVYARDREDGIVYRSVRHPGGTCICAFRPRLIFDCVAAGQLMYAWNGSTIDGISRVEPLADRYHHTSGNE